MALRSYRHESSVDPDRGVYVEMEGVMEVLLLVLLPCYLKLLLLSGALEQR